VRRAVCEDACENAREDARGAEKKARDRDEAPSTWALSRAMRIVWGTALEVLRGLPKPLPGSREPPLGSGWEVLRIGSWEATQRVRKKISGKRSESAWIL
jgi:hypothetical protein